MDAEFRAEVRRAAAERRKEERHRREEERAYQDGRTAYAAGEPRTSCTARKAHKINAFLRGWDEAKRQTEEYRARKAMTAEERERLRARWAAVRALLEPTESQSH